ncbi:hypothetical protein A2W14_03620 [Candidatus Gottesmanbacteria bacterium RBG_16_37_8]|uniref:Glycosyl transferase family 1 domain-containing protein n=1 Tax=Candidatus Gottesmanbacteria bacterium RBG_16_37_8 TaxID=1798371 RepID=A0A1F5YSH0_9BACT|nr:MAG: hypothetical protein A2W14_03620 [Candidatus Gottesmanbacteria bacterium RBG_16_37_8]
MRILFSITYFSPYVSGLTLYVKRLAEEMAKRGHTSRILCMEHKNDLAKEEKINKVAVFRAKPLFKISKGFLSLDFILKSFQLIQESDVLVVNLPQFEGFITALWGKIFKKKIIAVYHCEVVLPSGLLNNFAESTLNISNYLTLLMTWRIVTYTEDFSENSRILSFFKKKIKTIYPPIIVPKIDKRVQKEFREKISHYSRFNRDSRDKKPYLIGVAARLASEKGIEYLLEAIPILNSKIQETINKKKKFKIVIAGSMTPVGEERYKDKILKLVEKYKDYVVFLGELKEEEMGSFYSLLDVLVLPSVNSTESFGMVQVEAMLMGVPVIATDLPGVRVPIKKSKMGLVVPVRDSQVLAEAIFLIINNKKDYIKQRSEIENEFTHKKTWEFYENLLSA